MCDPFSVTKHFLVFHENVSGISRTLSAPAGINKLLIPFNSRDKSFRIEVLIITNISCSGFFFF